MKHSVSLVRDALFFYRLQLQFGWIGDKESCAVLCYGSGVSISTEVNKASLSHL